MGVKIVPGRLENRRGYHKEKPLINQRCALIGDQKNSHFLCNIREGEVNPSQNINFDFSLWNPLQ